MTGRVVKNAAALRDLAEAADYLRRRSSPNQAIRFLREADSTFTRVAGMPGIGTRFEPDVAIFADLRFVPVSRFKKYLVFYRPIENGVQIVRVLHGARDIPGILTDELDVGDDADEDTGGGEGGP